MSRYSWAVIFLVTILLIIPGCSGQSAQKPAQQDSQQTEIPPEFEKIVSDTEQIILLTDQKWKMRQNSTLRRSTSIQAAEGQIQESGQSGSKEQQQSDKQGSPGGKEQQNNQDNQQGQKGQQNQAQSGAMPSTWEQESKSLMNIHENWTALQAKAMQAGMTNATKQKFDENLDRLTTEIHKENDEESLLAAIDLYGRFDEIARLFKAELPPTYYNVKYQIMKVTALGQQEEWEDAQSQSVSMLDDWDTLKNQAQKAEKSVVSCTEIAIQDLARAVDNQSKELVLIKGEIAVKEMAKLKEELSKKIPASKSQ
mgnify:CR=1 FL=1